MRKLLMGFLTTIATLFAATTANAAARWSCEGAEYVCGSASKVTQSYSESEPQARRASKQRAAARATNDDEAPVRRQKVKIAKSYDNDEASAPRRRGRSYANDQGGGETLSGKASYYWQPQALASGGRFNPNAMTAAHKTLPFGTRVRVTNHSNGQSVEVVINDRGPYIAGRIIDLSKAAAHAINMQGQGVAPVSVRVLGRG
ncbi:MAG: septal ring lytic transglycosylase RlpA family protein [Hyphomicrobiaceae bacterium]